MEFISDTFSIIIVVAIIIAAGITLLALKCYNKVDQGRALIRNGWGGTKVYFDGAMIIPVIHKKEFMDLSVKRIVISRTGKDGLICKDNLRADIKVAFFIRVNKTKEDVIRVAESLGTLRASDQAALKDLFDAKFSEALKTVGKQYDFVDLYNAREDFRKEILQLLGNALSGYQMFNCAIDYLEQTEIEFLNPDNILDAEGIKKITELTAHQKVKSNLIDREREMTIRKQDVEAEEAILELNRQLAETTEKQQREIAAIKARESAETIKVQQQERLRAETARIATEEDVQVAEENKQRQVIVALRNKERTDAVEKERIEKDRQLEIIERQRIVTLADIEKEKAVEEERKNIQDVIRERVIVEKAVVEEEERIKDTKALAEAERVKNVTVTNAERDAEEALVKEVKAAEAEKVASELLAQKKIIEADAALRASDKEAEARKVLADAKAKEEATIGLAEVQVLEAKARATEMYGTSEANVIEKKAQAEAKGEEAKAEANRKFGLSEADVIEKKAVAVANGQVAQADATAKLGQAEANVLREKMQAEADGLREKAEAMNSLNDSSRSHEEFRLHLAKAKEVELAALITQERVAHAQAEVLQEGLKTAKIDIVGGEAMFFDKIVNAIGRGKAIDRTVDNSHVLQDVKNTFFSGDPDQFRQQLSKFVSQFNMSSEDVKNLTVSALLSKMMTQTDSPQANGILNQLQFWADKLGLGDRDAGSI